MVSILSGLVYLDDWMYEQVLGECQYYYECLYCDLVCGGWVELYVQLFVIDLCFIICIDWFVWYCDFFVGYFFGEMCCDLMFY